MSNETLILLCVVGTFFLVVSLWCARRYDKQIAKSTVLIDQTNELQAREAALLDRWEAVVTRLERVAERLDRESDTGERTVTHLVDPRK